MVAVRNGVGGTDILHGLLARAVRQAESLDLRLRVAQLLLLVCTARGKHRAAEAEVRSNPRDSGHQLLGR